MGIAVTLIVTFFLSTLSGMGVGGGGLFVIFLALFTDLPQLTIQGMNLLIFLFSCGGSLIIHLKKRTLWGMAILIIALCGIPGSLFGTWIAGWLPQKLLRKIFGVMLIITGIMSLKKK